MDFTRPERPQPERTRREDRHSKFYAISDNLNRRDRDAIYDGLMTDLTAIGDIFIDLQNDESASAKRLRRRFEIELRLLDDLGWEREPETERFELGMPAAELRPIIERFYWSAVNALADRPEELTEEAIYQLRNATSAYPATLAGLVEDTFDPEAGQGTNVEVSQAPSE